jgi:hypothetical protein
VFVKASAHRPGLPDDGSDVARGQAVEMDVQLAGTPDRGPRLREGWFKRAITFRSRSPSKRTRADPPNCIVIMFRWALVNGVL